MAEEKMFTVKQVADVLQLHPETVRRWLRDGKIKGVLMGGDRGGYRVAESEVARVQREGVGG
jgi:excisionase family DNA binding protein